MLSPWPAPFLPSFLIKNSGMETGILFSLPVFSIQDRAPYKKVSPSPATCFNDPNQRPLPSLNCRWRLRSADPEVGAWWHAIMRLLQLRRSPCTTRYLVDCITGLSPSSTAPSDIGYPTHSLAPRHVFGGNIGRRCSFMECGCVEMTPAS